MEGPGPAAEKGDFACQPARPDPKRRCGPRERERGCRGCEVQNEHADEAAPRQPRRRRRRPHRRRHHHARGRPGCPLPDKCPAERPRGAGALHLRGYRCLKRRGDDVHPERGEQRPALLRRVLKRKAGLRPLVAEADPRPQPPDPVFRHPPAGLAVPSRRRAARSVLRLLRPARRRTGQRRGRPPLPIRAGHLVAGVAGVARRHPQQLLGVLGALWLGVRPRRRSAGGRGVRRGDGGPDAESIDQALPLDRRWPARLDPEGRGAQPAGGRREGRRGEDAAVGRGGADAGRQVDRITVQAVEGPVGADDGPRRRSDVNTGAEAEGRAVRERMAGGNRLELFSQPYHGTEEAIGVWQELGVVVKGPCSSGAGDDEPLSDVLVFEEAGTRHGGVEGGEDVVQAGKRQFRLSFEGAKHDRALLDFAAKEVLFCVGAKPFYDIWWDECVQQRGILV